MTPSVIYENSTASTSTSKLNGMTGENQQLGTAKSEVNATINETTDSINKEINDTTTKAANQIKDALGLKEDSPLKLGDGALGNVVNGPSIGDGNSTNSKGASASQKKLPQSGDKNNNYGNNDFWVVKLKDKNKPKVEKEPFETFPNPTAQYTNVIVNQDFESGTASVYDLAGRQLQSFAISEKTIPIDLNGLPDGIYIVNIRTNKENGSVKIIKSIKSK